MPKYQKQVTNKSKSVSLSKQDSGSKKSIAKQKPSVKGKLSGKMKSTTKKNTEKKPVLKKALAKKNSNRHTKARRVVISSSNVKERTSRSHFELAMLPWVSVPTGGPTDNGHDYTVQIISAHDLESFKSDGKFFLVQLKSQSKLTLSANSVTPHAIETKKIRQWYNSSSQMPFLYVVNDLVSNKFYYVWIDEEFISGLEKESPFWTKQESVTIKIPAANLVTLESKELLREYVFNYRQTTKKLLEPGVFFDMKDRVTRSIDIYDKLVVDTPFESVKKDIEKVRNDLQNAVYRIAITGLSRVGKSTLINTLLKRPDISPADVWQTTGVPILIQPGRDEHIQVNFLELGKTERFDFDSDIIKQYAAREHNEDNHKKVRDVSVFISSTQLERGVMFYDIPGLNDPNDAILDFAYHTADCANAILYIIDGALVASGSFVFSNEIKKQIERFSQKDKVFLIINKVDRLTLGELNGLKSEIDRNLDKYNLRNKVADKIYYLSINPKTETHLQELQNAISKTEDLEKDLWAFMLSENKVGFFKLYSLMKELQQSGKKLEEIIRARSLDAMSKEQLNEAIKAVKKKVPELEVYIKAQNKKIRSTVRSNLELRKNSIIESLEKFVEKAADMPSDSAIKDFLVNRGHDAVGSSKADVETELSYLNEYIDKWIENNLKGVREIIDLKSNNVAYSLKDVEEISLPPFDFSSTWGTGIVAAIAGFLINPVVGSFGLGLGIGGAILDLILGGSGRRAKRIRKMTEKARTEYNKAFSEVEYTFNEVIDEQTDVMIGYINRKLKLYFKDIESQISQFQLDSNFNYVEFAKTSKERIAEINRSLGDVWEELQIYLTVIKPLAN